GLLRGAGGASPTPPGRRSASREGSMSLTPFGPSKPTPSPCTTSSGIGTTGAATGEVLLEDEPEGEDLPEDELALEPLRSESFSLAGVGCSVVVVPESDATPKPTKLPRSPATKRANPIKRRTMMPPRARCSRRPSTRLPDARARLQVHSCWIAEVSDADGRVWNPERHWISAQVLWGDVLQLRDGGSRGIRAGRSIPSDRDGQENCSEVFPRRTSRTALPSGIPSRAASARPGRPVSLRMCGRRLRARNYLILPSRGPGKGGRLPGGSPWSAREAQCSALSVDPRFSPPSSLLLGRFSRLRPRSHGCHEAPSRTGNSPPSCRPPIIPVSRGSPPWGTEAWGFRPTAG